MFDFFEDLLTYFLANKNCDKFDLQQNDDRGHLRFGSTSTNLTIQIDVQPHAENVAS